MLKLCTFSAASTQLRPYNLTGQLHNEIAVYRSVLSLHTALASPSGRGTSRREGERDVQTVGGGMQLRIRFNCCKFA